jgi:hypothetical protein
MGAVSTAKRRISSKILANDKGFIPFTAQIVFYSYK